MNNKLSLLVNFIGVDKMSGALRNIIGLGKKGSGSLNQLRGEGRKLERQLREVRGEIKGASGNITQLAQKERQLEAAIEGVNRQMDRRKRLNAIEGDRRAMMRRGENLKQRGQENMMQGASLAAPLILAGSAAMRYDKSLALIAQKTDLNKQQTIQLGNAITDAARAAKRMPDQLILAADFLAGKGFDVAQIEGTIGAIGKFSTAWDADDLDASKAAFAVVNSLAVPISKTSRALEIMAVAGKEGGFEVRDMAQHFPALSAEFATFGHKGMAAVASLSAGLQVLEANTGDGSQAATNLSNLMTYVKTERGIKRFQKFGIDITAALKKAEAEGRDPLETLIDLTNQATGGDKSKMALLFSNQQAMKGILALTGQADKYKQIRDAAFSAQGITAQEFERMSKTSAANWNALKGSASLLAISLGTHLLPVISSGMDTVGRWANAIGEWAKENPALASTILKLVAGLAVFKIGLGAAQFALGGLLGPLASGLALYRKWKIVGSIAKLFPNAALAVRGLGLAFKFMLGPVGLAIMIIGLLAYAVYANWDKIKAAFWKGVEAVNGAWTYLTGLLNAGLQWFLQLHVRFVSIGRDIVAGIANGIRNGASAVLSALKNVVMGGVNWVTDFLGIKSPSRLFMKLGAHTAEGMAIGIDRGGGRAIGAAGRMARGVAGAGALAMAPAAMAAGTGTAQNAQAAPAAQNITIKVYQQAGEDGEALARRISRIIKEQNASQARRSYEDQQ